MATIQMNQTALANMQNTAAMEKMRMPEAASEAVAVEYPESLPAWEVLGGMPIQLDVTVPLRNFRVRDLLAMEKDTVVQSRWMGTSDVPLCCDGVQLYWAEFETISQKIAVRLTMLG